MRVALSMRDCSSTSGKGLDAESMVITSVYSYLRNDVTASPPLERQSRKGKDEVDRESQAWLAQEKGSEKQCFSLPTSCGASRDRWNDLHFLSNDLRFLSSDGAFEGVQHASRHHRPDDNRQQVEGQVAEHTRDEHQPDTSVRDM